MPAVDYRPAHFWKPWSPSLGQAKHCCIFSVYDSKNNIWSWYSALFAYKPMHGPSSRGLIKLQTSQFANIEFFKLQSDYVIPISCHTFSLFDQYANHPVCKSYTPSLTTVTLCNTVFQSIK